MLEASTRIGPSPQLPVEYASKFGLTRAVVGVHPDACRAGRVGVHCVQVAEVRERLREVRA